MVTLHLDNSTAKTHLSSQGSTASIFISRLASCISNLRLHFIFGLTGGGSLGILTYQSMSVLLHLGKSTISGNLRINAFIHPWTYQVSCVFSPPTLVPLILSQAPCRTCHRSIQTSFSSDTLFDGGFLASQHSQHFGRDILSVSHHKRPYHKCFSRLGGEGSVVAAFNPLAA